VNTQGDRRCDGHANDHLVYSLYYPPHDRRAAQIKEHCVDNAVGLDSLLWCEWQPEVQSKVDVLGCRCAGGTSVKSRETDRENSYKNLSLVFSYERCPT